VILKIYGDFDDFEQFWAAKNKPNSKPVSVSPQHCWGLKKQSQFAGGQKWRKVLHERIL